MFMTSLMSFLLALAIFVVKPSFADIPVHSALIMLVAGIVYFLAILPYLYALMRDEASRVIPLFEVQPIFSFVLAWLFLHERLNTHQIVAGLVILIGSLLISLDLENNFRVKKTVFFLMMLSTLLFATEAFLFKFVGLKVGFWSAALYQDTGCFIAGAILFSISASFRRGFISVLRQSAVPILFSSFLNETFNVIARLLFNYATLLAPLALVSVVGSTQPIFVLLLGILLTIFWPKLSEESLLKKHLVQKTCSVLIIFIGTYLLFQ
jgi:drug/metabolite transporter (DMT)-like permease